MDEDIDVVETVVEDNVPSQPSESEIKARRLGWVPKEEFKGNQDQWRDADEFLKRGEEIHGYLKNDLERLHATLSAKDREIAEIKQVMEEFRKFHNETEARAYKRAIDDLKREKAEAVRLGDGDRVVELDDQIDQLKEAQKTPEKTEEPARRADEVNRDYLEWLPNNRWYIEDPELQELADDFGEVIKKKNPNLVGKDFLEEVTKRVRKVAPEKFENPNRFSPAVSTSSDSRAPASSKKKRSYENLPQEAKQACDRFVKQGLMTREQYVKEFEWD
jgi:cell division septum initiation protein DivIVA